MERSDIILDQESPIVIPAVYLKRSLILLRIYAGEFFLLVLSGLVQKFLGETVLVEISAGIAGLGLMAILAVSPLGLFYSFKAFRKKEGTSTARLWHLIGHLLVFTTVAPFISLYISSLQ